MILDFITFRKRRKMYEQVILSLQSEIDKLRDGKTTLRMQRYELQEEVAGLKEENKTLKRKKK